MRNGFDNHRAGPVERCPEESATSAPVSTGSAWQPERSAENEAGDTLASIVAPTITEPPAPLTVQ